MDLYLIRHAQSSNNALVDDRQRVRDPELTELGRRQADLLAAHLAASPDFHPIYPWQPLISANGHGYGITRLYTSAMRRALQTAWPIGQALGLQPEVWIDIHEHGGIWLDHGAETGIVGYGGITRNELMRDFPGYVAPPELTDAGWWQGSFEGLPRAEARAVRVAQTLRDWGANEAKRDEKIAIISHGAFSTLLLRALLGEASQPVFYHLDNAGIALIRFRREIEISVRYLNRLPHLPAEMIT
jgi:2,3-bisphosphoglycerate-dependent phosphoglycerate mutase/probable phosphoglycerate mutase